MSDEVNLGGKTYISSKRASEATGYAQDYIGQLARKGAIDAQRIGGLWYVHLESLMNYKEKALTFVPQPPKHENIAADPDSLVFFDGKDYVSASKASEITGYHPDYVGQLARGGKVLSQQIGNRWYVDRAAILAHKEEKDGLLAAVQVESVGLANKSIVKDTNDTKITVDETGPFLTYVNDTGPLMPNLGNKPKEQQYMDDRKKDEFETQVVDERTAVPIHVDKPKTTPKDWFSQRNNGLKRADIRPNRVSRGAKFYVQIAAAALSVVILIGFGASAIIGGKRASPQNNSSTEDSNIFTKAGDVLEPLLTQELSYLRQN